MAPKSAIKTRIFIVDTSYLLELFKVPGCSNPTDASEIKRRWEVAIEKESRFYVPFPCILELGNHIADVDDGNKRKKLAHALYDTVKSSVESSGPWTITPSGMEVSPQLCELCKIFVEKYVTQGIDLTDTAVIREAHRLKKKYSGLEYSVHIWTKDRSLKAQEPDREEDPFLG